MNNRSKILNIVSSLALIIIAIACIDYALGEFMRGWQNPR